MGEIRGDNATQQFVRVLPRHVVHRLLRRLGMDGSELSTPCLQKRLGERFTLDLPGLLNVLLRAELDDLACALGMPTKGSIAALRMRLWHHGATLEAGTESLVGTAIQPVPIVLRSKLVHLGQQSGLAADADRYPRSVPPPIGIAEPADPDCLEQLLANADLLIGCRLGTSERDKGAYGTRIAAMLGVPERGYAEPDWHGEVEIKTVPVMRDRQGWWYVKEDPAVSMETTSPIAKLHRVLWIARVADENDSPILSWYYQELGPRLLSLVKRYLHTRPKGPRGAQTRGWYIHKRYFVDSGFLQTLNGQ